MLLLSYYAIIIIFLLYDFYALEFMHNLHALPFAFCFSFIFGILLDMIAHFCVKIEVNASIGKFLLSIVAP